MNANNAANPAVSGQIRQKTDFLPQVFVSAEFDGIFLPRLISCFKSIIAKADRKGKRDWTALIDTFEKHGLFELKVPLEITLPAMEFNVPDGKGKTKTITYQAKEPLAFGFRHVDLDIDRARLVEPAYLNECSAIYAYLFCRRLFAESGQIPEIAILRLDETALWDFLYSHHRGQVSTDHLSRFLIGRTISPFVDKLPVLAEFDRIGEQLAATIEARLKALSPLWEANIARRAAEATAELNELADKHKQS